MMKWCSQGPGSELGEMGEKRGEREERSQPSGGLKSSSSPVPYSVFSLADFLRPVIRLLKEPGLRLDLIKIIYKNI